MPTGIQQFLDALPIERSGLPIYIQIREQMLAAIGSGVLRPGEQMPTMRQVAVALRVDLNTVRHAYAELERARVIRTVRGVGTFVAESPPPSDPEVQARRVERLAQQWRAMAAAIGIDPAAVARRVLELAAETEARS